MVSHIPNSGDRPLVTFGKGFVLLWIVTCLGSPQQSASQDQPVNSPRESTHGKEAPVIEKPELVAEKSAPITPKIPPVAPQNARVRELQEERLKVLQELVAGIELQFGNGNLTMEAMWQARENLLEAQLELSETKADRIRIHQELVQGMESLHRAVKTMVEHGVTSRTDELGVRSNLLKAQIALEKEKASPK